MLTNPITGKIIKQATSNKFLLEVVNNWFPNKYIPTTKVLKQKSSSSRYDNEGRCIKVNKKTLK
jgi:hypothetical protein|tara:strand:+ start:217 stop:408 length:192 start_codon:yes stop_codon:yes gene_type:complete